jgi:hypothetical protein
MCNAVFMAYIFWIEDSVFRKIWCFAGVPAKIGFGARLIAVPELLKGWQIWLFLNRT